MEIPPGWKACEVKVKGVSLRMMIPEDWNPADVTINIEGEFTAPAAAPAASPAKKKKKKKNKKNKKQEQLPQP
jgi:ribosomal protein L12E/L44/L45/RPP1/RPP2